MSVNGDVVPIDTSPCTPADDALAEQWHRLMRDYSRMTCALDRACKAEPGVASDQRQQRFAHAPARTQHADRNRCLFRHATGLSMDACCVQGRS